MMIYLVRAHQKGLKGEHWYDYWLVRAESAIDARIKVQEEANRTWGHGYWYGCKVTKALSPTDEMRIIYQDGK